MEYRIIAVDDEGKEIEFPTKDTNYSIVTTEVMKTIKEKFDKAFQTNFPDVVIIDGVDVAECEFFSKPAYEKGIASCSCYPDIYGHATYCDKNKDGKNCPYKRFKRAKFDLVERTEELRLAKQLIDWMLKYFQLTEYDWQNDQNEICAEIEEFITHRITFNEGKYNCLKVDYMINIEQKQNEIKVLRGKIAELNNLLAELGCPTQATARRLVHTYKEQNKELKEQLKQCQEIHQHLVNEVDSKVEVLTNLHEIEKERIREDKEKYRSCLETVRHLLSWNEPDDFTVNDIINRINEVLCI